MECKKCEKSVPIVNKKYWLCNECNFMRLNNGATRGEVYSERAKKREEFKTPRKTNTKIKPKRMKQQTSKERIVKGQLSELKQQIREEANSDNMYYCWGCGIGGEGLDCSHILSVGQRKDLELDKDNINLFCRGCHNNWESNDFKKMYKLLTFEKDLIYIREHDSKRYNQLISMMEEYCVDNFDQLLETNESIDVKRLEILLNYDYLPIE